MKKASFIVVGLIVLGLIVVVLKTRKGPQPGETIVTQPAAVEVNGKAQAIDDYLAKNPADPAAPQLRRLSTAMKARPAIQDTPLGEAVTRSIQGASVLPQETAMLDAAAALAEQDQITDLQMNEFSAKFLQTGLTGVPAIDHYIQTNPSGRGVPELRRVLTAYKARPTQTHVLTDAAARSVQDGFVSVQEAAMLTEAANLAERDPITEPELQAFSTKYPETATPTTAASPATPAAPQNTPASVARAASAINTYLQKHPSGRGAAPLRRLSAAIKARPVQLQKLAETAARSIAHGSISKKDAVMLEEAAALSEQEGLSPKEMAEFSNKYEKGVGLSQKPESAKIGEKGASAPLTSFDGKQQLIYTFTGAVQCAPTPCSNIRVNVRVSAGKWVETRQDGIDGQGHYVLQMPVMSGVNEKVQWRLDAQDKDLRATELTGQRITTEGDSDVSVKNNLLLNAVPK